MKRAVTPRIAILDPGPQHRLLCAGKTGAMVAKAIRRVKHAASAAAGKSCGGFGRAILKLMSEADSPRRAGTVSPGSRPAVFLDRDGVINRSEVRDGKPYSPRQLEDFCLLPGVPAAITSLKRAGFLIIVVTNQPDIGNGQVDPNAVAAMHDKLRQRLPVDSIEMCPHRQVEGCPCRKPKAGMLTAAASRLHIDLAGSFMVGDRWSDVVAGHTAGCYTVFVNRGYREALQIQPDAVATSLPAAARLILARAPRAIIGDKVL